MRISKLFFLLMSFALIFGCSRFDAKIEKTDIECNGLGVKYRITNTSKTNKINVKLKCEAGGRELLPTYMTLKPGESKLLCSWRYNMNRTYKVESEEVLSVTKHR